MEFSIGDHHSIKLTLKAMLNSSSNLYKSEWLDVVFKNRNKNYGAYVLRAESSGNLLKALMIAAPVFIMLFVGPMIYSHLKPKQTETIVRSEVPVDLAPPVQKIIEEKKQEEPAAAAPVKEKVKMVKLPSNPVVVKDPVVEPPVVTLKELEHAVVGPVTQEGVETTLTAAPATGNGTGITGEGNGVGTEPVVDNNIYNVKGIEAYPEFEGGMKAWAKFIQRNLRYPSLAEERGVQGRVMLSFVIEKDGSISNVTVLNGIGNGCDEEAMRVIKKSPRWKPGRQNDQTVRVRYTMPLSFTIAP